MWGSRGSRHVSSRVLQPLPDWVRLGWWKSSKHSPGADPAGGDAGSGSRLWAGTEAVLHAPVLGPTPSKSRVLEELPGGCCVHGKDGSGGSWLSAALSVPSTQRGQAGQQRAVARPGWMEAVPGSCPGVVGVKLAAVFV